jgi:L-lactate dehydrogenase complex protein LldG
MLARNCPATPTGYLHRGMSVFPDSNDPGVSWRPSIDHLTLRNSTINCRPLAIPLFLARQLLLFCRKQSPTILSCAGRQNLKYQERNCMTAQNTERFIESAKRVGAEVLRVNNLQDAVTYIKEKAKEGTALVPETPLVRRHHLRALLADAEVNVFTGKFRNAGQMPGAGVTFCNFCLADSGTVVLESTDEEIRLATTLPEMHFILADPATILEDNLAAVEPMTAFHRGSDPKFIAYITGPSRTADIERILTIGCHGPREVHILLVEGISNDLLEN